MKLIILLCVCFVCEIANNGVYGYWERSYYTANTSAETHTSKNWSSRLKLLTPKDEDDEEVVSRRQNPLTTPTDHTARHRSPGRLITMNKVPMLNAMKPIRKQDIKSKNARKKQGRQEDQKPSSSSDVLKAGVLNPYNLREQLQYIVDTSRKYMNASVEVLGTTAEYNEILLIKMSQSPCKPKDERAGDEEDDDGRRKNIKYEENVDKKIIFIVHNLNPMGTKALVDLTNFMKILSIYAAQLKRFDIFLMPVANPDGIGVQLDFWYKNVSPQDGGFGVNLDHNFDVAWKASVENSWSQFYQGPAPFSEPETKAIRDIFFRYNHNMVAYMNIHASTYSPNVFKGDAILYPKGYSEVITNDDKYFDLKGEIEESLRNASLHLYSMTVDSMHNWYGKVTGKSVDYASSIYGVPYALEICMQPYAKNTPVPYEDIMIDEVWDRVFRVIFNSIEKSLKKTEERMRRFNFVK